MLDTQQNSEAPVESEVHIATIDEKKKSSSSEKKKSSSSDKKKSSSDKKKSSSSDKKSSDKKSSSSSDKKKSSSDKKKSSSSDKKSSDKKSSSSSDKKKSSSDKKKSSSSDKKSSDKKSSSSSDKKKSSSDKKKSSSSDKKSSDKKSSSSSDKKKSSSDKKKSSSSDKKSSDKHSSSPSSKDKQAPSSDQETTNDQNDGDKTNDQNDSAKKDSPKTTKKKDSAKDSSKKGKSDSAQKNSKKNSSDKTSKKPQSQQHLVSEEPDTTSGSLYVESPTPLPKHDLTVDAPDTAFPFGQDSSRNSQTDQVGDSAIHSVASDYGSSTAEELPGIAGEPIEYQFRNDNVVTSLFMLSFFILAWVVSASWKFVRSQLRDFFITRERPNLFAEREDNELRGRWAVVVQTCILLALLFFYIAQEYLPDVFEQVSPHLVISSATGIAVGYYLLKIALYNLVNHTFFSQAKCRMWNDIFYVSILATGFLLLPVVLSIVFLDVSFEHTLFTCILLLSVIKTLMLYKCCRIFFCTLLGSAHLILYFCALEIIPMGIFAAALVATSTHLLNF